MNACIIMDNRQWNDDMDNTKIIIYTLTSKNAKKHEKSPYDRQDPHHPHLTPNVP